MKEGRKPELMRPCYSASLLDEIPRKKENG